MVTVWPAGASVVPLTTSGVPCSAALTISSCAKVLMVMVGTSPFSVTSCVALPGLPALSLTEAVMV